MSIFDILGPVMVGPSSSHTAGAVRIGYVAAKFLQEAPVNADITLHGSFATTGIGHGTDKAIVAGLLGMKPDNMKIPESFLIAKKEGLSFHFYTKTLKNAHPNTALLQLCGKSGQTLSIQAASIGGGRINIQKIDGIDVNFSAEKPTLIIHNLDMPGHVGKVASMLCKYGINIATMNLNRHARGGDAVMVMETDQDIPKEAITWCKQLPGIIKVTYINIEE